jgi:negative regulator of sigma E activity
MKNEPQELRETRQLLSRLPNAPLSPNFTARVMLAVEREEARHAHWWDVLAWNWHWLLPRFAVAAAVMLFAGVGFHQYESAKRRAGITQSVMLVASAQKLPSLDALQNFDAIQRMSQPAHADEGLLALAPDLK